MIERLDPSAESLLHRHYATVLPMIARIIGGRPFTSVFLKDGPDGKIVRARAADPPLPEGVQTIDVDLDGDTTHFLAFNEAAAWSCLRRHAIAFESWTPAASDSLRAELGHLILTPIAPATDKLLHRAALALRMIMRDDEMDAIPTLDGGITLWVPFSDGPDYPSVRAWLHSVIARAAEAEPDLLSKRRKTESAGRIHVWVGSNAPGQGCNLPYSIHARDELRVVTPIAWSELESCGNGDFRPENFEERLASVGDRFAAALVEIGDQRLPQPSIALETPDLHGYAPRSKWLTAAFEILSDGRPRKAEDIYADAIAHGLLPAGLNKNHMYLQLKAYLERMVASGRRPRVIQDLDYRWRINHPADDWPVLTPVSPPPLDPLLEELHKTHAGPSDAFEKAVLNVFGWMGFVTTHLGGNDRPDGLLDAPLGPAYYRVMVECKTAQKPTELPDVWEASKYKDAFKGDFCMLIYPEVAPTRRAVEEAQTHGVSVWNLANVEAAAKRNLDLWTMRDLFQPGIVDDHIDDLFWELEHGATKRIKTLCDIIVSEGWRTQNDAATATGDPPELTVEAAMFLVDAYLHTAGAKRAATRSEVEMAFTHLRDPLIGSARAIGRQKDAITILRPWPQPL